MNRGAVVGILIVIVVVIAGWLLLANRSAVPADELVGDEELQQQPDAEINLGTTATPAMVSPLMTTSPGTSPAAAGQVKTFSVTGTEFRFSLPEMRVKQGDTVRVTLTNGGTMPHDWKVDEFNAATKIVAPGGQPETVEFVAGEAGTFEYYCSVGQHRANGMVGKLIVE